MSWSRGLVVEAGGHGVVSHAGSAATRMLADRTGLTGGLSGALARRGFTPLHDRGRVITDLAVAIADGATTISEIDTLRHQEELFGPVASDTTAWRALAGCDGAAMARIGRARARTRRHVWEPDRGPARPASRLPGPPGGTWARSIVVRLDATIVIAHSDKEQAKGTFKGTYGHHPLTAWCDNTGESLAVLLRPGNAGEQYRRGPYRRGGRGDRADPGQVPAQDADHLRRRRVHPRPGRSRHRAERPPRLPGPLLGRARLRRADPRRAAGAARDGVERGPGGGRARPGRTRRSRS